jgi:hypothetical protein
MLSLHSEVERSRAFDIDWKAVDTIAKRAIRKVHLKQGAPLDQAKDVIIECFILNHERYSKRSVIH